MTVLSDKTLRLIKPVEPFVEQEVFEFPLRLSLDAHHFPKMHEDTGHYPPTTENVSMTYGLSQCGYDIRIDQDITLGCGHGMFHLASSFEEFNMPNDVMGVVHDKSSWARRGLSVKNTVIEPGWRGFLTLELFSGAPNLLHIKRGCPIAQVVFHKLDQECEKPYNGKYQDQERGPQVAR
jgi:dCTP deaminase